ncbi:MAG: NAD-dependent epimerase/dehydratase family protein [Prevotellaceae bacterium]|jgi:nucleoside-diphosphate-sugar epimerase|nr:NAD-dependent epimerase/dehydratase family protein [Prevotellaceae bacterium]
MNILITGASGFLGTNICPMLSQTYQVVTAGLTPQEDYTVNLASEIPHFDSAFDVVLHAAGKAHSVPRTDAEKQLFYDVNLQGTKNLCTALEQSGVPKAFVFISTVAVYGCDYGEDITEEHPLDGNTPYADSKKQAELFLQEWCGNHQVKLSIIRPSLLAGSNPPGNLGAMISGIRSGRYLSIAGGKAKKSVLMVQDIARLVPLLVEKGGIYNVCDSHYPSFRELEAVICRQLGKKKPFSIPYWVAKLMAIVGDCLGGKAPINSLKLKKIVLPLTFSNEKAKRELNWEPLDVLNNFIV